MYIRSGCIRQRPMAAAATAPCSARPTGASGWSEGGRRTARATADGTRLRNDDPTSHAGSLIKRTIPNAPGDGVDAGCTRTGGWTCVCENPTFDSALCTVSARRSANSEGDAPALDWGSITTCMMLGFSMACITLVRAYSPHGLRSVRPLRKRNVSGKRTLAPSRKNSTFAGRSHGWVWLSSAEMRLESIACLTARSRPPGLAEWPGYKFSSFLAFPFERSASLSATVLGQSSSNRRAVEVL